uniref:Uncharacterized protein n=1 Tax=Podoviridae sp. ctUS21 TaxID=2826557 RepID=A0A8S5MQB5_9CAUD|nr:MAG TPA: hypothetical protein [Podoviridae sp. ctUS21]
MACAILSLMYGRDTRPAQILNTLVSVLWVVLLLNGLCDLVFNVR